MIIIPYILQKRRPHLDPVVKSLVETGLEKGIIESFLMKLAKVSAGIPYYTTNRINKTIEEADKANIEPNGDINYILFKCCKYHIKPSYNNYKTFMGEIYKVADILSAGDFKNEYRESAEWIRIKILTPYEEEAIKRNGDV